MCKRSTGKRRIAWAALSKRSEVRQMTEERTKAPLDEEQEEDEDGRGQETEISKLNG